MLRLRHFFLVTVLLGHTQLLRAEVEVANGLTSRPAVDEGLLAHPFAAALDHRGRLFVSDSEGIKRLEDSNLDGVFDTSTLVTDELTEAQGILWVDDSLYILSPPSLWKFTDTNGDAIIEECEELASGFAELSEATGAHGPFLHPNGRIYWTQPRARFEIPDSDTDEIMFSGESARIWFCQITGSDLDFFAGGGIDAPSELDFTDRGEILGVSNGFYGRPRGDALAHWIYRGAYPRRDQARALAEHARTGDLLPGIHNFGSTGVSGFLRYRSGQLERNWTDQWFTTHLDEPRVTRTRMNPNASSFEAAETETVFRLESAVSRFTDLIEDHNGDLLVIDSGTPATADGSARGRALPFSNGTIHRIFREGTAYQPPAHLDWDQLNAEDVANLLLAEEHWVRAKAITELAVRGAPAIPELRDILMWSSVPESVRQNAVWALARMKFSGSIDLIYDALTDPSPNVRQAACNAMSVTRTWQQVAANQPAERNIELERNRTISGALAHIVRSDEPAVARSAAVALGRMGEFRAIGAILGRLGRTENDRFLGHSLIYALIEIDDYETTHAALDSENPRVLNGVVWALEEMPSSQIEVLDVLPLLEIRDTQLRKSLVAITANHPNWDAGLANRFFEWADALNEHRVTTLELLMPGMIASPPINDFITAMAESDQADKRSLALSLINLSPETALNPAWMELFLSALNPHASPRDLENALGIAARYPGNAFKQALEVVSKSDEISPQFKADAASILEMISEASAPSVAQPPPESSENKAP